MKALVIHEFGNPQVYAIESVEEPVPAADEVLVGVHSAAISYGDTLIATGRYQVRPQPPFTPGSECSGIVLATGSGVTGFAPGDRVCGMGFIGKSRETRRILGSCRERVAIPARNLIKLPDHVDLERAAMFRANMETSYYCLQEGRLQPGEVLLVMGAGGGTGLAAVELGKLIGARVIGSASSPARRRLARDAGADLVIDSTAEDWRAQVEAFGGPNGVDVVYDPVGGALAERSFRTLGYHGRYLVVGFAAGSIPKLPLNLPLMKAASVIGANLLRGWEAEPERIRANAAYLLGLFAQGKLSVPPVARRYTLDEAGQAFADVAAGTLAGRALVRVDPGP
jgi:NADPH:quinone reductase